MTNLLARRLAVFDDLTAREADMLDHALGSKQNFASGQDILRLGDRPGYSTLIVQGWAARLDTRDTGARQITALHVPGDFVDLHNFLLHTVDSDITALTPCQIIQVPHDGLRRITESEPHLTRLLWMSTVVDASVTREWLSSMGHNKAVAHMAHLICELYVRLEAIGLAAGLTMQVPLTQVMLGEVLGISTVHVSRSLQELRGTGLVRWQAGEVTINDWPGLTELARFEPVYLHVKKSPR